MYEEEEATVRRIEEHFEWAMRGMVEGVWGRVGNRRDLVCMRMEGSEGTEMVWGIGVYRGFVSEFRWWVVSCFLLLFHVWRFDAAA